MNMSEFDLIEQLKEAQREYRIAISSERMADPEYIEAAIYRTNAAKSRYYQLLKEYKEMKANGG